MPDAFNLNYGNNNTNSLFPPKDFGLDWTKYGLTENGAPNLNFGNNAPNIDGMGQQSSFLDSVATGVNVGSNLLGGYLSLKNYGLAKDAFRSNQELTRANFSNSVGAYNRQIEDQDILRSRADPTYQARTPFSTTLGG